MCVPSVSACTSPSSTSARIIVTMGMPAFLYRWFFIGAVESIDRNRWLAKVRAPGAAAR
jgi:hypothetical protein